MKDITENKKNNKIYKRDYWLVFYLFLPINTSINNTSLEYIKLTLQNTPLTNINNL